MRIERNPIKPRRLFSELKNRAVFEYYGTIFMKIKPVTGNDLNSICLTARENGPLEKFNGNENVIYYPEAVLNLGDAE